jgi:hypothetical protein
MANGDVIVGKVSAGSVQTRGNRVICEWDVPENTTARVEVHCIVQQVYEPSVKEVYVLTATIRRDSGNVSVSSGPTERRTNGVAAGISVTINDSGSYVQASSTASDGEDYRISCFMDIYSVEQVVIIS